jgi:SNF2 family DNA or RNA helicase
MKNGYEEFIRNKSQIGTKSGFEPVWMPDFLFGFQKKLVGWSQEKGKAALFEDCGLGKTPQQLVWAENIVRKTGKRVLILTPLAVAHQTVDEGQKFGIEVRRSINGELFTGINVTNYERLHLLKPEDFVAVVADESSRLKAFDGTTRQQVTEFIRCIAYRLLCTATAAPNDYIELGTSSEALGELGYMDMLQRFFKNDQNSSHVNRNWDGAQWRFKGHAEKSFWKWVCSWSRAIRKPSDLGFDDSDFKLPPLVEQEHCVKASRLAPDMLFALEAVGLNEQREERRRTIEERCNRIMELVKDTGDPALVWCHLNPEGDLLEKLISDSEQVSGSDSDEVKEEKFTRFAKGQTRVLVTKPKIGAWGLNFQHCAHVTSFPSHSFEQYYQGVRRCWRFGQKREVRVDIVTTEGEKSVLRNLKRKSAAADKMFSDLVAQMNDSMGISRGVKFKKKERVPAWL